MTSGSLIGLTVLGVLIAGMVLLIAAWRRGSATMALASLLAIPVSFAAAIVVRELLP